MFFDQPPSSRSLYRAGHVLLEKYLLLRLLGEGGMGSVWLAHNLDLDALVAIKLLRTDVEQGDAPDRLKREARSTARLAHSAIVRVFDFGVTQLGHPFFVMEHLEGQTLSELLRRQGRLEPTAAVQIVLPIMDALSSAHAKGIVHRDLKPDNILLAQESRRIQPKLLDFGIARVDESTDRITCHGAVLGSPAYMAPEQAQGVADVDHRADIWAIAMVIYDAVAGKATRCPSSVDDQTLLRRVLMEDVTPLLDADGRESSLWWVISRALVRDREGRFQSMRAFGSELAAWLLSRGISEDVCGEELGETWDVAPRPRTLPGSVVRSIGNATEPTTVPYPAADSARRLVAAALEQPVLPHIDEGPTLVSTYSRSDDPANDPGEADVPSVVIELRKPRRFPRSAVAVFAGVLVAALSAFAHLQSPAFRAAVESNADRGLQHSGTTSTAGSYIP
jgi:serine/threonine-protein kinase